MGNYEYVGEHKGSPKYELDNWILYKGKNGEWFVGDKLDETYAGVQLWNPAKTEGVPFNGWEYCWKVSFYKDNNLHALGYCGDN